MSFFFQSTKFKLSVANKIYLALKILRFKDIQKVQRSGIRYILDIREGIDLSLFLFGSFQRHVWDSKLKNVYDNYVIFDIGANIGSISLPLAKRYPNSVIHAFEPTGFAFSKFNENLNSNPDLKNRIILNQAFLSDSEGIEENSAAYSSWRIDGIGGDHPVHGGTFQKATNVRLTLDSYISKHNIKRLDFIKIDVDGPELKVLEGAELSIGRFHPKIIFEFMGHSEANLLENFAQFESFFQGLDYSLFDAKNGKSVNRENIPKLVPPLGGVDILAIPNGKQ